ncbi:MAG: MCE family protein [Muribaculaceae bacterium]|nr:MCE family protein [Muribaculaceae bacterium]
MKKNILIAVTIMVSLALLYWGIEFLKGINMFQPANFYYATFNKVNGLAEAAPVSVNGFQVGQVREMQYDYQTNQIKIMLSLDENLKIPRGSTATIVSSITGSASVAINLAEGTDFYTVGENIPGVIANGLMDKAGDMLPQIASILPKVDSIMTNLNRLTADPALATAVARLDGITAELANSSRQLSALMSGLNKNVPGVMTNVNEITGKLNTTSTNFVDLSAKLNGMPIDQTISSLNATMANFKQVSDKLNSKDSSLGLLLNDRSFYDNANATVADLDSLFMDIRRNPKRYVTIKVF